MQHDDPKGERIAGIAHLAYAGLYIVFCIWHFKGAMDHFRRLK